MKQCLKAIITFLIILKAKRFLKKHHTQVIAVTGSVGKTSTKNAVAHILKKKYKVYASPKGFNTSIGIGLTLFQEESSGFSSPGAWLKILKRILFGKHEVFQKIILEMGADSPGDIRRLTNIAPPKIGIVTNVNPVHLAEGQFKSLDEIQREKEQLVRALPRDGLAILNADDPRVAEMKTIARRILIGTGKEAAIRATDIHLSSKGIHFKAEYKEQSEKFEVPVLGRFQIYVLLPAIAVALKMDMGLKEIAEALRDFKLPPGRMNPIPGRNDSRIIDSSYNASPTGVKKALELLAELKADRKIAALGTMNELGELSREAHLEAGKQAASCADLLLFVGQEAATLKHGALEGGANPDQIYTFFDSAEAGAFLKEKLLPGDLVLVKGSQNRVRLELLVKAIMKNPDEASRLLCRQEKDWKER